ncbi:hypothetical protein GCM10010218_50410 [Streptomyces mashuensis]|uniref:Small secreted protein n=1 Tax=Streptomyces mashuensis TaxID=33904 RepID=A0A919B8I9_9ACTN|nr:small secreted protein [Streptomyces mashuensis]GHF62831.1 hypothetical protein GCM10010218_50410 [Streptomyces mashuensis]
MNKKLVAALSGGAALVLSLTACGGGGDDGKKKLDDWAKKVCDQMQPQVKKITDANVAIAGIRNEQDSKKIKEGDSAAFQSIAEAYKALATSVQQAGPPPGKDGETNQKNAVKALNDLSSAYTGLKQRIDKLDTGDQGKFGDGLNGIASDILKLSNSSDDALKKLQSGDVGKAMAQQHGCQRPPSPAAPATPSKS